MKVRVMIQHDVDPALLDILEKVDTAAGLEIVGPEVMLYDVDMTKLEEDIRKVCRQAERINKVYARAGSHWIARDVLEGKAVINAFNQLTYLPYYKPKTLKEKLEFMLGPLSDKQFKEICEIATDDIRVNMIEFGQKADIETVIKIAARCYEALKRCGQ